MRSSKLLIINVILAWTGLILFSTAQADNAVEQARNLNKPLSLNTYRGMQHTAQAVLQSRVHRKQELSAEIVMIKREYKAVNGELKNLRTALATSDPNDPSNDAKKRAAVRNSLNKKLTRLDNNATSVAANIARSPSIPSRASSRAKMVAHTENTKALTARIRTLISAPDVDKDALAQLIEETDIPTWKAPIPAIEEPTFELATKHQQ